MEAVSPYFLCSFLALSCYASGQAMIQKRTKKIKAECKS